MDALTQQLFEALLELDRVAREHGVPPDNEALVYATYALALARKAGL